MAELLKYIFNEKLVEQIGEGALSLHPGFHDQQFVQGVINSSWEERELKDRMRTISTQLYLAIDLPYKDCVEVILELAPKCDKGLENMVFPDLIEVYGLEDWSTSVQALKTLTHLSSSEFAIRPFILRYPEKTMTELLHWSANDNEHIRRLASEGCRPRLPWAMALPPLKIDPAAIWPILENLKQDDSLYVRKSVANNLNDISKDNPELVLARASEWQGVNEHSNWIIKHGLRTLLKQGNTSALRLFGFQDPDKIKVHGLALNNSKPKIGDSLRFDFELQVPETSKLRLEYAITYAKKSGSSRKIFQLGEKVHKKGSAKVSRKQSLANMSTRKHYAGQHILEIVVNGEIKASKEFLLRP